MTASTRPRPLTRAQCAAFGVEIVPAILHEAAGHWRDAAFYFARAGKTVEHPALREWCEWSATYAQLHSVNTTPPVTEEV